MDVSKSVAFPRMGVSMNILFHPISWLRLKLAPESESAPLRPWGDQHSNHWPRIQSHRTLQQHSLRSSTPTVKNPLASTHSRARKEGKVTKKKYQMRDARGNTKLSCSPSERITRWEDARRMLAQGVRPRQREPEKNRSTRKKRSTATRANTLILSQYCWKLGAFRFCQWKDSKDIESTCIVCFLQNIKGNCVCTANHGGSGMGGWGTSHHLQSNYQRYGSLHTNKQHVIDVIWCHPLVIWNLSVSQIQEVFMQCDRF